MKAQYIQFISELDRVIGQVRLLWLDATTPADKLKWRIRIDELLDERLKFMAQRDAA